MRSMSIRPHAAQIAIGIGLTLVGMLGASIANVIQARPEIRRYPLFAMLAWSMAPGRRSMASSPSP